MLTSRGPPPSVQSTGMGSVDEELCAMLQSGHHSHAQSSLASVMAAASSSQNTSDLFSSQFASLQRGFPAAASQPGHQLATPRNMNLQKGGLLAKPTTSVAPQWSSTTDEKWVIDAKNEALHSATLRGTSGFGAHVDGTPLHGLNAPPSLASSAGGGLQRYHSAPPSFLQCLADFNEDAFSQVTSPLGNRKDGGLLNTFFADNLAPIIECAPPHHQQMDTAKVVSSNPSLNDFEQYLATQNDFGTRSATATSTMPSGTVKPQSLSRTNGLGGSAEFDSFNMQSRSMKNSLIRQSSSPADLLATIQDNMDESNPSLPMVSADDSLSGGTSEENAAVANGIKTAMYSRDDCFLVTASMASGGLWNMPPSPGHLGGKRLRVPGEMSDDLGFPRDGTLKIRVGEPGSLTRHQSLPMPSSRAAPLSPGALDNMGIDDLADFSAPCKTRARRGCATHPRSIAERVRRTRISERMKKLQDLVPNMDRQTNTADMLDEAVEYVKQLQSQVQELSETVSRLKGLQQAKEL